MAKTLLVMEAAHVVVSLFMGRFSALLRRPKLCTHTRLAMLQHRNLGSYNMCTVQCLLRKTLSLGDS